MSSHKLIQTIKSFNMKNFAGALGSKVSGALQSKNGNLILAAVIILLLNVAGYFWNARFDITSNNSYSLSGASRDLLASLDEPLTIKVFFSKELPAPYNATYRYAVDLLDEYTSAGGRNVRCEMIDMEDEVSKKMAAEYRISQIQVNEVASDQMKSRAVYMGIVLIHGDLVEKMNEVTSPDGLEYRITTAVKKMAGRTDALLSLNDKVSVTLYASGDLKNFNIQGFDKIESTVKAVFNRVNEQNYRKLTFAAVDPSADRSVEAVAQKYALQKITWKDEKAPDGRRLPAGEGVLSLVLEHGGKFQTVPLQISPTVFGRYVIAGMEGLDDRMGDALSLLLSHNMTVGYVNGHGEKSLSDERAGSGNLKKYLSESYEIKEIDTSKEQIPGSISTLIVNGPRGRFSDDELYALDQFMMKGGNILFFVESFNEMQSPGGQFGQQPVFFPADSGLDRLFSSWGVTVNKDYVMDKKCFVQRQSQMGGSMPVYFAPLIEPKTLNGDNPVTADLKKIIFLKVSSLTINKDRVKNAGLASETLVSSSKESWLMKGQINLVPFMIQPPDEKQMQSYPLAVELEGKFTSVFGGVRPVPASAAKAALRGPLVSEPGIAKAAKTGKVIIAGSSDITGGSLADAEGKSPNTVFIANAVDYLNGDTKSPEMRSKGLDFNPIGTTEGYARLLIKFINIGLLPLLVIISGVCVWRLRRSRRKKIRNAFSGGDAHE
ncbi:MAG: GldG family protein [Spirochaetota bacterium]